MQHRLKAIRASAPARLLQKFMDDRALTLASLLAWGMLNTFLPLLLGILSLAGLLLGDSPEFAYAQSRLLALLPDPASTVVQDSLAALERSATSAGLISLGFLLFNGSNFFVTLETVFGQAYHVPDRNLIKQRVVSLAALFVMTACLLVTSAAAFLGGALGGALLSPYFPWLSATVDNGTANVISAGGLVFMLVLMYWWLPNSPHRLLHALPGAVLASIALLLVVRVFPLYIQFFGGGFSVYAAFGSVLLFMFWLYVVGVVLVAGAVLNAFLEDPEASVARASLAAQAVTGQLKIPSAGECQGAKTP